MLTKRISCSQTFNDISHGLPVTQVDSIFDANFINNGSSCRSLKSDEDLHYKKRKENLKFRQTKDLINNAL
jgi:hypothetical protein